MNDSSQQQMMNQMTNMMMMNSMAKMMKALDDRVPPRGNRAKRPVNPSIQLASVSDPSQRMSRTAGTVSGGGSRARSKPGN